MARQIHLRLSGRAEAAFERLIEAGLTEQDILSRALWILDQAVTTNRVALLDDEGKVVFRLGLEATDEPRARSSREPEVTGGGIIIPDVEQGYERHTRAIRLEDDR